MPTRAERQPGVVTELTGYLNHRRTLVTEEGGERMPQIVGPSSLNRRVVITIREV